MPVTCYQQRYQESTLDTRNSSHIPSLIYYCLFSFISCMCIFTKHINYIENNIYIFLEKLYFAEITSSCNELSFYQTLPFRIMLFELLNVLFQTFQFSKSVLALKKIFYICKNLSVCFLICQKLNVNNNFTNNRQILLTYCWFLHLR